MKAVSLAVLLVTPVLALACDADKHAQAALPVKTVNEVALLQKAGQATMVNANGQETRAKYGVVPGAVLLTSSSRYDPAQELPADKSQQLVFYCANVKCDAAPGAAKRASAAGYTHVAVMSEGIIGWVNAGRPVQKSQAPRS